MCLFCFSSPSINDLGRTSCHNGQLWKCHHKKMLDWPPWTFPKPSLVSSFCCCPAKCTDVNCLSGMQEIPSRQKGLITWCSGRLLGSLWFLAPHNFLLQSLFMIKLLLATWQNLESRAERKTACDPIVLRCSLSALGCITYLPPGLSDYTFMTSSIQFIYSLVL